MEKYWVVDNHKLNPKTQQILRVSIKFKIIK